MLRPKELSGEWAALLERDLQAQEEPPPRKVEVQQPTAIKIPCDGCRHFARCQSDGLGCRALELFATLANPTPERLRVAPRQPSREIGARVKLALSRS